MRIRQPISLLAIVAAVLAACGTSSTEPADYPVAHWRVVDDPVALGWSSEGLAAARAYAESVGSASGMIVHDGLLIEEWGRTDVKYNSHSIRKSLLSALYGIYAERGIIDL
jgi:hypothetical protein